MLFGDKTEDVKKWLIEKQNESLFWEDENMSAAEVLEIIIEEVSREQSEIGFRGPAFDEPI